MIRLFPRLYIKSETVTAVEIKDHIVCVFYGQGCRADITPKNGNVDGLAQEIVEDIENAGGDR